MTIIWYPLKLVSAFIISYSLEKYEILFVNCGIYFQEFYNRSTCRCYFEVAYASKFVDLVI